jgi:hypothetical protein
MIYPLHLLNGDTPAERALIDRSLKHWISFEGALQGYSFTGASAISSKLGRGDDAARLLNQFLDRYVKPNTMYLEAGPVIETPLSAAQAVHEMLLQSWGDRIRVFPAVPADWQDVAFADLRAEGAFLVSAARRGRRTQFVRVHSLAGEPCRVQTDLQPPIKAAGPRAVAVKALGGGVYELDLHRGETAVLTGAGPAPVLAIEPTAQGPGEGNPYGTAKARPVAQAADGSIDLPAARAAVHGSSMFYEKSATLDNLGRWIDPADWASWTASVTRPGRYRLLVTYAVPGGGSTFRVTVGDQELSGRTEATGSFSTFKEFALGEVSLPAGLVEVAVRAVELRGALMNLQRLRLVPVR